MKRMTAIALLAVVLLASQLTDAHAGRCSIVVNGNRVYIQCPKDAPTPTPTVQPAPTPAPVSGWENLRRRLPR